MHNESLVDAWLSKIEPADAAELTNSLEVDALDVEDAFSQSLAFGTGGLRGMMGMGPNRMNIYTVAQATQGLANYLLSSFDNPIVAVCRDSRNMGERFVKKAAGVLAANGIATRVFPRVEPTPALSFAVRALGCEAGINITASHNPAVYNGYKVYGPDGCQITPQVAQTIQGAIEDIDIFEGVRCLDFDEALEAGFVEWIDDEVLESYLLGIVNYDEAIEEIEGEIGLVYTPLNGVGLECMTKVFSQIGIDDYRVVSEQAMPNGDFPTCPSPNPEIRESLELGLKLSEEAHPDLLLATDPDADRVGVAVPCGGDYEILTGNEVGVLLLDWLCRMLIQSGSSPEGKVVVSTVVSSALADELAVKYGFELRRTLTGFKYIGEQIGLLESVGELDRFLFGFEESCGYLAGTQVRDKDGVMASMLICQMARWYRARGASLHEVLDAIYREYGFYRNALLSVSCEGVLGMEQLADTISGLRKNPPRTIAGLEVVRVIDYAAGIDMPILNGSGTGLQKLEPSNVLEFRLEDDNRVIIRPSGTEPKAKAYLFSRSESLRGSEERLASLRAASLELLGA